MLERADLVLMLVTENKLLEEPLRHDCETHRHIRSAKGAASRAAGDCWASS